LHALNPRWIHCNGVPSGKVISKLLGVQLQEIPIVASGKPSRIAVGWAEFPDDNLEKVRIPILAHTFLGGWRGNHTEFFAAVSSAWQKWLGPEGWRTNFA